jgi:tetratricopeptide (TPR) repeat protein
MRAARRVAVAALLLGATPVATLAQSAPVDPYYEFLNARHLEGEGDNDGALAALQRAAAADPSSAEIRAEIASFYQRRNKRAEAEQAARQALTLDQNNVEGNRVVGQILASQVDTLDRANQPEQAMGVVREAIPYFERAVAGSVGVVDPTLNLTLGRLYLRNGQPDKAQQALARVLSQNPGSATARLAMAQAQVDSKDLAGAINTLDEIVDDEPRVAATLAAYDVRAGLLPEAVENFTRALTVNPNNRQLKAQRILLLYDMREFARAAAFAADAQRQHPDDPQFPRLQASALMQAGDAAKAITVLEGTIKQFPKDAASQLALAEMYGRAKRFPDQEKVLRQLLTTDPTNADAMNSLGYMLAVNNDRVDEAIRLLQRAVMLKPGQGEFLDSLGWAYFRKGNLVEADANLAQAIGKLPNNPEVLDHIGEVRAKQGRWQEAIDAWTRALAGEDGDVNRQEIEQKIANAKSKIK